MYAYAYVSNMMQLEKKQWMPCLIKTKYLFVADSLVTEWLKYHNNVDTTSSQ